MILFELIGTEDHQTYQDLQASNAERQYYFLSSLVHAAIQVNKPFLSTQVIKALNYHAIACLHTNAGEFRPCDVVVTKDDGKDNYQPPRPFQVQAYIDDMVNFVNRQWETSDPVLLAAYVLWRLNWIHPFINGNGRTARAACYFILCMKAGGLLQGDQILPELIRQNRDEYVVALEAVDKSYLEGKFDLTPLHSLLIRLLQEQVGSDPAPPDNSNEKDPPD